MTRLLVGALALAVAGIAQAESLEEVVVTAQKREQNIIDVPFSVTNVEGRELGALFDGGADIRGLSARVPGLYVESSNGRVAPRFYIRGLGNIDFDLAASQPVSVIMDEVVMENVILKSFPLFDIDRAEISKGPQGSLFGRNTTAGIVKLVTRKPTMERDGYVDVDIGTLGTQNFEGAIGGGFSDTMAGRLSVLYQSRDDYINNAFTGGERVMGGFEETAVRGQLLFEPSDSFSALLNLHSRSLDGTASVFRANIFTAGSNELNQNYDRDVIFFDEGMDNPQEYDSAGASLQIDYDYNDMVVTSITAFESADGRSLGDIDGGYGASFLPFMGPGFIPFNSQTQDAADVEQFTQELRIANDPGNEDGFGWQAGLFYFDSNLSVETNPFFAPATTVEHDNQSWAVFAQATVPVADKWEVIGGIRYTDDEKSLTATGFNVDLSDDQITGDLSVTYALAEDATVYARWANGFKAPTIQGRDIAFFGVPSTATSETSNSFEVGLKQRLFNGRGEISAAVFRYIVDDIQFTAVGGATNSIRILNAKRGIGEGFEVQGRFLIGDNFELNAGYAYNDTEIQDGPLRVGVCAQCTVTDPLDANGFAFIDGNPFPNAPEFTFNISGELFFPMGADGELFAFADYALQGRTNIFLYESLEFFTEDQNELGLQIGYRKLDGRWEITAFGRNLTDEDNVQGAIDFNNNTGFVNEPRVVGIKFSSRFN